MSNTESFGSSGTQDQVIDARLQDITNELNQEYAQIAVQGRGLTEAEQKRMNALQNAMESIQQARAFLAGDSVKRSK